MKIFRLLILFLLLSLSVFASEDSGADSVVVSKQKIKEVVVSSGLLSRVVLANQSLVESVPAIMGEHDIIKYITTLPGVVATSILDANFYVRGGAGAENQYLVNGFPVASPQHVSGLMSLFDPYVLRNSTLYKSGYPAQYSGVLSSYLNMFTRPVHDSLWHGEFSLGMISSSIKASLPVAKQRGVLAVSLRASYLKPMLNLINSFDNSVDVIPYSFVDATASYTDRISKSWTLRAFGVYSSDKLEIDDNNLVVDWSSYSLNGELTHRRGSSTLSIGAGVWGDDKGGSYGSISSVEARYGQNNARIQLKYNYNIGYSTRFEAGANVETSSFVNEYLSSTVQTQTYNFYLSAKHSTRWGLDIDLGLNLEQYCGNENSLMPLPRANISYPLGLWSLWGDYARTAQYTTSVTTLSLPSPADFLLPLESGDDPSRCDQWSLGAERALGQHFNIYLGAFYRTYKNVKEIVNASFSQNVSGMDSLTQACGYAQAQGIEMELKFSRPKYSARLNYTFIDSWREFEDLNSGSRFNPPYDITHNILAVFEMQISDRVKLNAMWQYSSGVYVTFPIGVAVSNNILGSGTEVIPIYDDVYNFRLPATHRLDVSAEYNHKNWVLNLGIYNLYNQANVSFISYDIVDYDTYNSYISPNGINILPFIPYLSMTYKW